MCLALPSKIMSITDNMAVIDAGGASRTVSLALLEQAGVGDFVLVHAGFAISVLDEEEAAQSLELFHQLAQASSQEE